MNEEWNGLQAMETQYILAKKRKIMLVKDAKDPKRFPVLNALALP